MGSPPEISRPPGWEDFVTGEPPPIPEKSMASSLEAGPPPIREDAVPQLTLTLCSENPETIKGSSLKTSPPPPDGESNDAQPNPPPGSPNLEKNTGSAPKTTKLPGWEIIAVEPTPFLPGSENQETSMNSPPETSPLSGWENPAPPFNPVAGSVNLQKSMHGSPETTTPPGWESIAPQPNLLLGSLSTDKSMGSSPKMSMPPGLENVASQPIRSPPLPEHQVGNVKCRKSCVLLIYPYGAPSVRCSSCRFVTEIGAHNVRPPLSVQQGRFSVPQNPVH